MPLAEPLLPFRFLEAYGIDPGILAMWEQRYGPTLLPIQARALRDSGLISGRNLIVFAPTSAGKTLVGEILAVTSARRKRRVLYLVPLKALAEEKFLQLRQDYAPPGLRVAVSTHERREFDREIESGDFDIAILVYEKLSALLVRRPGLLGEVGLVVVDELQLIGDQDRGPALELLLTKLRLAEPRPQLLGLSAVIGECRELARWLGADLLVETGRPVELRKGILSGGVFRYREHNSGLEGEETWPIDHQDGETLKFQAARYAAQELGEPTLVFLRDKPTVERFARALADQTDLPSAEEAIEELQGFEESEARDLLLGLLRRGIAVHTADLGWEHRELVERSFRQGAIRLLVATSTLALGLNLPAKNVLVDERTWHEQRWPPDWQLRDITRAEFENKGGRAGRKGLIDDFGRAILVLPSPFHAKTWYESHILGDFAPMTPTLDLEELDRHTLNLLASGHARTAREVAAFLRGTFTGTIVWAQEEGGIGLEERIAEIVADGVKGGLFIEESRGWLQVAESAVVAAQKGITLSTCLSLLAWLRSADPAAFSELEVLLCLARTPDGEQTSITLSRSEALSNRDRAELQRLVAESGEEGKPLFREVLGPALRPIREVQRAIKKALTLSSWIGIAETREVERRHRLMAGILRRLGGEFSWLAEALAALAKAEGWPERSVARLRELADRLIYGVPPQGLALSRIRFPGLSRTAITRLLREGYETPEDLRELPPAELARILPRTLARKLHAYLHPGAAQADGDLKDSAAVRYPVEEEVLKDPEALPVAAEPESRPLANGSPGEPVPILVLNPRAKEARYRGHDLELPPSAFRLLSLLAARPGRLVTKEEIYDHLWPESQDKTGEERPYERQIADHKRKLMTKLRALTHAAPGLPKTELNGLILTKPRKGYLLNLTAQEIMIACRSQKDA